MGRLYLVPTPIGNLEDITLRALRILREVPVVLAEDTRHTHRLLTHHGIRATLVSYHAHNESARAETLRGLLDRGDVALVTDAGMPAVSDPGAGATAVALAAGHAVEVLPGASAVTTAWAASGIDAPGFLYVGFLPRRAGERRALLQSVRLLPYALVAFETPHRIRAALDDVLTVLGNRPAVAARELTKLYEEVTRGTVCDLIDRFAREEPRGELTLVLGPPLEAEPQDSAAAKEELQRRRRAGESGKAAVGAVAAQFGMPRNEVYRLWLESSPPDGGEPERAP